VNLKQLFIKNRSYRRFFQEEKIDIYQLKEMVENVRYSASAANLQPMKFILVNQAEMNTQIYEHLNWAAYLKDWKGPEEGERPAAYIIMIGDRKKSPYIDWDYGIALQTILLNAVDKGYGGCSILAFHKEKVRQLLSIPEQFEVAIVIALGKPKENVVIDIVKDGDIRYWRDKDQRHHVPKRDLEELIYQVID
jgi:nitroreductase